MNEYTVDYGGWLAEGWRRFTANWGPLTGFFAVYVVIVLIISAPVAVVNILVTPFLVDALGPVGAQSVAPLIGSIPAWLIGFPVGAFLVGGLFGGALSVARGERPAFGDLFRLGGRTFVPMLGLLLILLPFSIGPMVLNAAAGVAISKYCPAESQMTAVLGWSLVHVGLSLVLGLITVTFSFAWFLIIDEQVGALAAVKRSVSVYCRHYFLNTLYLILISLICGAGMLGCCVGAFFTAPLSLVMFAVMYLRIFGKAPAA